MLVRQEKIALLLLFTVAIILAVSFIMLDNIKHDVLAGSYSEDSREGSLVMHRGNIDSVETTRSGGHLILDVSGVKVFIPGAVAKEMSLSKGDFVEIYGIVELYQGEREIVVENENDLVLVKGEVKEEIR